MKQLIASVSLLVLAVGLAVAADNPDARISIGDNAGAFRVKDITGPSAGETICYRCQYGRNPVACLFVREITPEVARLIASLDEMVGANKERNFKCFVVLLTADAKAGAKRLAEVAKEYGFKNIPLTMFDTVQCPRVYRISEDAVVTLFQWNNNRFTFNRGFSDAKLSDEDRKAFLAAAKKMMDG